MHRIAILMLLGASGPAFAQQAVALPDPGGLTLLGLGLAGLVIGRHIAARRKNDD